MAIFHSYVKLPEGIFPQLTKIEAFLIHFEPSAAKKKSSKPDLLVNCSQLVTQAGRLFAVNPFYFYPRKAKLEVYGYMLQPRMPWLRLLSPKKGYNLHYPYLSITSIQLEDQRYKPSSLLSTPVLPWHCPSGISPLWSAIRHTLRRATPLASVANFSPRRRWRMIRTVLTFQNP